MLYFIIAWMLLTVVCYGIGTGLLNYFKGDCFEQRSDRFMIAVWLGVVTLCISFLATSLVLPLSTGVGLAIALILVGLSVLSKQTRHEVLNLPSSLSPGLIGGFITLQVLVAAVTAQQITWFDTGLYHFGSIQWLSKFGAVPGIALINSKFGFTSSWFALAAPLTPGFLGSRVGGVTNSFLFLMAICHFIIVLTKITRNKAKLPDWFIGLFLIIIISVYTLTIFGSPILISFSPDVAITFLIGVTSWAMLVITNNKTPVSDLKIPDLDVKAIPLILSAGAVSVKLSALPLLLVGLLFYLVGNNFRIQRIFWGSAICVLLLSPVVLFGLVTSGCPVYPSTFMCLDLPWAINIQKAIAETQPIRVWGNLADSAPAEQNPMMWFGVIWRWLRGSRKFQIMIALILTSIVFSINSFRTAKQRSISGKNWLILLGLVGMTFIMINGPLLRFGIGYFIVIPSLFVGLYFQNHLNNFIQRLGNKLYLFTQSRTFPKPSLFIPLFLIGLTTVGLAQGQLRSRLLLPPALPTVDVIQDQVNDVKYVFPDNWTIRCWATELPCSEVPIRKNIQLRDPSRGIGAGFVHVQ